MIIINDIKLPLDTDLGNLKPILADYLKTDISNIITVKLYRKSVDARKKDNVHFCCSVLAEAKNEPKLLKNHKNAQAYIPQKYVWKKAAKTLDSPPVVVGFGPAGMFAALTLARAGLCPVVIERGKDVAARTKAVNSFFGGGPLDSECNVQFGEGGAGTFSDGKLNTGIKNPRCRTVIETFFEHGAPECILTDAKPHIGTDILANIVKNIREEIIHSGGRVLFDTKLEAVNFKQGKPVSVTASGKEFACSKLILAIGHSARDTYRMLYDTGLAMTQKPFAVGVRIEHLQSDINRALYGGFADSRYLGAADYKLSAHLENGRGVYTFCMCPGGEVINASSKPGALAVNGMSYSRRDGVNSNSALLVGVNTSDFGSDDVLAGCAMQEKIEIAAYNASGGRVPVTTVGNFVFSKEFKITKVLPTVKPSYSHVDINTIFPHFVTDSIKKGIILFDRKIQGFADESAVITAPETRSSSPVRILRDEKWESVNFPGIYPCGEGAGYAGGIVSAAVDGICAAEKIIESE